MGMCSKPMYLAYSLNDSELNGDPLSDLIFKGIPKVDRILSNFGIAAFAEVFDTNSTSGYLEYSSIATNAYSPVFKGPLKSIAMCSQGPLGSSVDVIGSWHGVSTAAWQGAHTFTSFSTILSIPGNHIFDLRNIFDLTNP